MEGMVWNLQSSWPARDTDKTQSSVLGSWVCNLKGRLPAGNSRQSFSFSPLDSFVFFWETSCYALKTLTWLDEDLIKGHSPLSEVSWWQSLIASSRHFYSNSQPNNGSQLTSSTLTSQFIKLVSTLSLYTLSVLLAKEGSVLSGALSFLTPSMPV